VVWPRLYRQGNRVVSLTHGAEKLLEGVLVDFLRFGVRMKEIKSAFETKLASPQVAVAAPADPITDLELETGLHLDPPRRVGVSCRWPLLCKG